MDPLILSLILRYPHLTPWIIFISMVLTGCNLPISEDLMILLSGIWASVFTPGKKFALWLAIFTGAYLADQIAYWTGRLLGPHLLKWRWTHHFITQARLNKVHSFYERYGFWSFTIGRFIPFGIRNCLFISAGMGNMGFKKFLVLDGFAALISTTTGFTVSYYLGKMFGRHFEVLFDYLNRIDFILIIAALAVTLIVIAFICYKAMRKKRRLDEKTHESPRETNKD